MVSFNMFLSSQYSGELVIELFSLEPLWMRLLPHPLHPAGHARALMTSMVLKARVTKAVVLKSQSSSSWPCLLLSCKRPYSACSLAFQDPPSPSLGSFPTSLAAPPQLLRCPHLLSQRFWGSVLTFCSLFICTHSLSCDLIRAQGAVCVLSTPERRFSLPRSLSFPDFCLSSRFAVLPINSAFPSGCQ